MKQSCQVLLPAKDSGLMKNCLESRPTGCWKTATWHRGFVELNSHGSFRFLRWTYLLHLAWIWTAG